MLDNNDPIFEKWQRTMDFILEQQAQSAVRQALAEERLGKAEERRAKSEEDFNRRMAAIDRRLSRAIRLAVLDRRNERKRRQELEAKVAAARQLTEEGLQRLEVKIERFIDSMSHGGNGSQ